MLSESLQQKFSRFQEYKKGSFKGVISYEERVKQLVFVEFAKELVKAVILSNETEGNDFNQILKLTNAGNKTESGAIKGALNKETGISFIKTLKISQLDKDKLLQLYGKNYDKSKDITGVAAYGRFISGISDHDFPVIKEILRGIISTDDITKQKQLIKQIGQYPGLYPSHFTVLLYYLFPDRFPILNDPVKKYLELGKDEMNFDYYADVFIDEFNELKSFLGEKDFGLLDSFMYGVDSNSESNTNNENAESTEEVDEMDDTITEDLDTLFVNFHEQGRIEFVTFHPAYCYEEFIEGVTVETPKNDEPTKEVRYLLRSGIFKRLCRNALLSALNEKDEGSYSDLIKKYRLYIGKETANKTQKERQEFITSFWKATPKFIIIIDEINRGDISKIFGELVTLLEADKRLGLENEIVTKLPYSREEFSVPPNVYIIGTMNTADRSIALIDIALRRRFGFCEINPDFSPKSDLIKYHKINGTYSIVEESILKIQRINDRIANEPSLGRDKRIGHSFFFAIASKDDVTRTWINEILPLLEEYCYSDCAKINKLLFGNDSEVKLISPIEGIRGISKENFELFLSSIA